MEKQIVEWREYDRTLPEVTVNGHTYTPGVLNLRVTGVTSLGEMMAIRDELRCAVNDIGGAFGFKEMEDDTTVTASIELANPALIGYLQTIGWVQR